MTIDFLQVGINNSDKKKTFYIFQNISAQRCTREHQKTGPIIFRDCQQFEVIRLYTQSFYNNPPNLINDVTCPPRRLQIVFFLFSPERYKRQKRPQWRLLNDGTGLTHHTAPIFTAPLPILILRVVTQQRPWNDMRKRVRVSELAMWNLCPRLEIKNQPTNVINIHYWMMKMIIIRNTLCKTHLRCSSNKTRKTILENFRNRLQKISSPHSNNDSSAINKQSVTSTRKHPNKQKSPRNPEQSRRERQQRKIGNSAYSILLRSHTA